MSTTPTPAPDPTPQQVVDAIKQLIPTGSSSVSVVTDVGAIATAVSKMCDLAMTPQGQALLGHWRTDAVAVESWISKAATGISNFLKGLVKKP
jgi:uroporphyrinogen-III decarboxylase